MINKKFYVDIDRLGEYSTFLKKIMLENNASLTKIAQQNKLLRASLQDDVTLQVDKHIMNLKKILNRFNTEVDLISKKVREDQLLYARYNSKLK